MTTRRTVLVCTNTDCSERGSEAVLTTFRESAAGEDVEVRPYLCFSACLKGPNVVVLEDQTWYCGVQPADVEQIRDDHLRDGAPVARLVDHEDELTKDLIFSFLDAGLLPDAI